MWEAAGFLGMSEKTLRDTYGHHHPAHLRGAADAIASRPALKKEALVVSLVEEKAKRKGASQAPANIGGPGSGHIRQLFLKDFVVLSRG
jgi:hypothetical protein